MAKDSQETKKYIAEHIAKVVPILRKVGIGDFSQTLEVVEGDEFAELFTALNTMIADLKVSVEKNISLVERLEAEKAALENKSQEVDAANQQLKAANQQMAAANQQLRAAQKSLEEKIKELERFNKVTVGREVKMVELKEELERLKKQCGISGATGAEV